MSAHIYRKERNSPLDPCGLASWRALCLDSQRASPYFLAARIFRLSRARRFYADKVSCNVRIYLAGNLAICNPFYLSSIRRPPYIIGWLFVVNTFSAIAGYFLLNRAITSNANFSDIVCGVLILCSELISTNLSICAFLLLKYGSSATISCIISLISISSANWNKAKLSLTLTPHSSTILRKSHSLLISRFIIAVFIRLSTIGGSPFPLNIV